MNDNTLIAAVDLGSNSFRLQVARVVEDQIYPLDNLKDTVRLGGGLDETGALTPIARQRALECLARFGERLRGMSPDTVRVVGTQTLRIAKNAAAFLAEAEAALGFPIEIVAGREEARLIYLGAAHSLPASRDKRLIVDIGGGSTEFIIGSQHRPLKMDSVQMGCVSFSHRYFSDGKMTRQAFREAELAARANIQHLVYEFSRDHWKQAIGTSGTARSVSDILELNEFTQGGITVEGLEHLKTLLIKEERIERVHLNGLRPDRAPVLPGGLAILRAVFDELNINTMTITQGALRDGILYDLIGRQHHRDMREVTIQQFRRRYHIDGEQADRVSRLAVNFFAQLAGTLSLEFEPAATRVNWAGQLHEIGLSVSHSAYHKHSAYILEHADMPGFSRQEQAALSRLVLGHRNSLNKLKEMLSHRSEWSQVLALRLAALFCRNRIEKAVPPASLVGHAKGYTLVLSQTWLADNPLTQSALMQEALLWQSLGMPLSIESSSKTGHF